LANKPEIDAPQETELPLRSPARMSTLKDEDHKPRPSQLRPKGIQFLSKGTRFNLEDDTLNFLSDPDDSDHTDTRSYQNVVNDMSISLQKPQTSEYNDFDSQGAGKIETEIQLESKIQAVTSGTSSENSKSIPKESGDLWTCPIDGCLHTVDVADISLRQELIKTHYQEHAHPSEKLDLIMKYANPNQPLR